jgi:peroxiredoxin family protein
VLFATNCGCHALLADWSGLQGAGNDETVRAAGVAGLDELRDAAGELGVRMIACEAGLLIAGLQDRERAPGVEVAGVVSFLEAVGSGQMLTL